MDKLHANNTYQEEDVVPPDSSPKAWKKQTPESKKQLEARIIELINQGGMKKKEIADFLGVPRHWVYNLSKGLKTAVDSKAVSHLTAYEQDVLLGKAESDGSPRVQHLQQVMELLLENKLSMHGIAEEVGVAYPVVRSLRDFAQQHLDYKRERANLAAIDKRRKQNRMTPEWLIEQRFEKGLSLQAIGDQLGVTRERVRQLLARHGLNGRVELKRQMPKTEEYTPMNHSYFDSISTEEQAYWLGVLVAKAQPKYLTDQELLVGFSFRFSHELRPLAEDLMEAMEIETEITSHSTALPSGGATEWNNIEVVSPGLAKQLVHHGMKNPKYSEIHLPEDLPPELLRHFLRAYYEQRGSVTEHPAYFIFSLGGSKQLLENFIAILNDEGVQYPPMSLRFVGEAKFHRIRLTGIHKIADTLHYLYDDATIFHQPKLEEKEWFDRKYDETMAALDEKKKTRSKPKQRVSNKAPKNPKVQTYSKVKSARAHPDTPVNASYFDDIQTEAQAYWMGYTINRFIVQRRLKTSPAVHLNYRPELVPHFDSFYREIEAEPRIHKQKGAYKELDRLMHIASIRSAAFIQRLDELGLSSREWDDIPFPSHLPDKLLAHFVRGYCDSHAFLKKTATSRRNFVVGDGHPFLQEMSNFFRRNGIEVPEKAISRRESTRQQSRLELGSSVKIKQLALLLYGEATIYLPEKTHAFNDFFGDGES